MSGWCHQEYFVRFQLNVEQYGEILAAQAFGGRKCGDDQPSYDVEVTNAVAQENLKSLGVDGPEAHRVLGPDHMLRIEVKSKLSLTNSGKATVIHCSDNKFYGVRRANREHSPMTHLLFIKVAPQSIAEESNPLAGQIEAAWLMSRAQAAELRCRGKSTVKYIGVADVESMGRTGLLLDVRDALQKVAVASWSDA